MSRKTEVVDEDGNAFPPPEPGSAVAQIIYLLEYGRARGFRIGPRVQIGDTTVEVTDLRQLAALKKTQDPATPDIEPGSDMAILLGGE